MGRNVIEGRRDLWSVPTLERASEGVIEGVPSPELHVEMLAARVAERAAWNPGREAMAFVEQLRREAAGKLVVVWAWEKILLMLEGEGPYPVRATCRDVVTTPDADGKLHSYLVLSDIQVIPQSLGSDQTKRFFVGPDAHGLYRLDLGDLLELEVHER